MIWHHSLYIYCVYHKFRKRALSKNRKYLICDISKEQPLAVCIWQTLGSQLSTESTVHQTKNPSNLSSFTNILPLRSSRQKMAKEFSYDGSSNREARRTADQVQNLSPKKKRTRIAVSGDGGREY